MDVYFCLFFSWVESRANLLPPLNPNAYDTSTVHLQMTGQAGGPLCKRREVPTGPIDPQLTNKIQINALRVIACLFLNVVEIPVRAMDMQIDKLEIRNFWRT